MKRSFRLLWWGETVSQTGTAVTAVSMPMVAIYTLHASTFAVAALEAAVWLPWLLVGLPAGAWVDRLPRRPILLVCNIVAPLLLVTVPLAAWAGVLTLAQLMAVALLVGAASVFSLTAYQVFFPAVVGDGDLAAANAKVQGTESAAQIVGPGLGGLLTNVFGAVTGLLADAVSFVVCAVCLLGIRVKENVAPRQRQHIVHDIRDGLRFTARDPYLRTLALYSAAANLADSARSAIVVAFLVRAVGVGAATVGLLLAAAGFGGIVGALVAGWVIDRLGSARAILFAEICAMPFALLQALTTNGPGLTLFVAGSFVVYAGVTVSNVVIGSFRQSYCPRELLGRVTASGRFLAFGALPIGAILGGALATATGLRAGFWIITASQVACSLILLLSPIRRSRVLPDPLITEAA